MIEVLQAAFDASSNGIVVLDNAARVLLWNRWMEIKSGFKSERCQRLCLTEIFPELVVSRVYSAIESALRYGLSSVVSQTIHHAPLPLFADGRARAAGQRIPHRVDIKAIQLEDGRRCCLVEITDVSPAVARDEFLRRQAHELSQSLKWHQQSETRHRSVLDTAADGIITINADGTIESFNRAAERIFGYTAAEAVGDNFQALLEDPQHFDLPGPARDSGVDLTTMPREFVGRKRCGGTVPLEVAISRAEFDGVALFTVIMRDISDRKADEAALRESERRFRTIADVAPVLLWMCDTSKKCVYCNALWLEFTGREMHEVLGEGWVRDVHPDDVNNCLETYNNAFETRCAFEMEYRLRRKDGEYRWILDKGVPRYTGQGVFLGFIGSCIDISERHAAEDALRRAGEFAIRYARAKAEFVANMSHELRTPMNGILGMLSLLNGTPLGSEQREYLEVAQRSGGALLDIINNVLDFSKLEAGGVRLERIPLSPREIVEDVVELLSTQAAGKGIDVVCEVPANLPTAVTGDPGRLRQVLLNLVGNAVKFTASGKVIVRVHIASMPLPPLNAMSEQDFLRFEVEDTGIGIAPDAQTHIFDHFTQADAAITRRYGGTGLGLAICRQLVELMSGKLWVDSEPGRGSTFCLQVPCEVADSVIDNMAGAGLEQHQTLLIGPESSQMKALKSQFQFLGMAVHHFVDASAQMALEDLVPNARYDYVFLWCEDGLGVAQHWREQLQALACCREAAWILVCLRTQAELAALAKRSGFAAMLYLPTRLKTLRDRLLSLNGVEAPTTTAVDAPNIDSSVRILVVDDVEANRLVACGLLRRCGYEAHSVGSGQDALSALEARDYSLVFMDCQMPDMDGYATTAAIRALPQGGTVPIVALTASALEHAEARCLAAGMNDYLAKPFRLEQLNGMVKRWARRLVPGESRQIAASKCHHLRLSLLRTGKMPMLDQQAYDSLHELVGDDNFRTVLESFSDDCQARVTAMQAALNKRDGDSLRRLGHALKGAAGNVAAVRLAGYCGQLEDLLNAGQWELVEEAVHCVEAEISLLLATTNVAAAGVH